MTTPVRQSVGFPTVATIRKGTPKKRIKKNYGNQVKEVEVMGNDLKNKFRIDFLPGTQRARDASHEEHAGHGADHRGAWSADGFYADMDGLWTDATVNSTGASNARNRNVPGDGKFDPVRLPSLVELQVGRVDLANLPSFLSDEQSLLRCYLNKNHSFRHGSTPADRRGLIDDGLLLSTGEPLAVSAWRNFAEFFGASNTIEGDWLTTLAAQSYLWGFGSGGGTYTSCSGVATTSQLAVSDPRVVFTMFFGSVVLTTPGNFTVNSVVDFLSIPGASHWTSTINHTLTGLSDDVWIIAVVKGTDGTSQPLFPFYPNSWQQAGNTTLANVTDGNLGESGMLAVAYTNPLYVDVDSGGWTAPGGSVVP